MDLSITFYMQVFGVACRHARLVVMARVDSACPHTVPRVTESGSRGRLDSVARLDTLQYETLCLAANEQSIPFCY